MNIGKKIKALRMAKFMTQSELAGNEITRNMLSRIENGAAQPSLDTLRYLASRLNVSAGFLLAEEGDDQIYLKHNEMVGIKAAYLSGDQRICRDMCINSPSADDDEIQLILAECTLGIAVEEFCAGNLRAACEYFDLALEVCAKTIYNTAHVVATCAMYFRYMRKLSATLSSNYIDETEVSVYAAMNDAFCVYAAEFIALTDGSAETARTAPGGEDPYSQHVLAIRYMKSGQYFEAYECLHKILVSDTLIPEPMMYYIFCDLEICCKEIDNFRGAYEYSIDKIEILQKLLS